MQPLYLHNCIHLSIYSYKIPYNINLINNWQWQKPFLRNSQEKPQLLCLKCILVPGDYQKLFREGTVIWEQKGNKYLTQIFNKDVGNDPGNYKQVRLITWDKTVQDY